MTDQLELLFDCNISLDTLTADERRGIQCAQMYASQTYSWIISDEMRFRDISEAFLYLNAMGAPIQQGRMHTECARLHYQLSDDDMFANNRNLWPVLCRYLRAIYPELKDSVRIRKSYVDYLTLRAIPYGYYLPSAHCQGRPITRRDWE